jgi:transposase-like protein
MREPYSERERAELIRAVRDRGEPVAVATARLGVHVSTAYRWLRTQPAPPPAPAPAFALVVAAPAAGTRLRVLVGAAAIEVEPGFDADLLRAVVAALEAAA